jgi:nucleoside-diphosphate-sugar epimerase
MHESEMSPAVLITGASGFVGKSLSNHLGAQGHVVKGAMRVPTEQFPFPSIAVGNIGPETDWTAALAGCHAVVHLAAHVHVMRRQAGDLASDFHRVNVEGSENLARQSARAGVRRFVFLSSVKVNGEDSAQRAFVESDPVMPLDAYGASKAEAEKRLRVISAETGMEVVIVRPPLVYGPGVKANFLSLLRAVDSGLPLPLSSISNLRSFVYVANLVDVLETCLVHPAAAGRIFFVSDDHDVSTPQLIREIATAMGKKSLLFPFPPALLRGAGLLTGHKEQVARLTGSLQVDISSIRTTLGWLPPFTLHQGLAQTASWYRSLHR